MKEAYWTQIKKLSLCFDYYLYFDTAEHIADSLLSEIRTYKWEFLNPKYKYHIIICRVWKKDSERLMTALDRLPNKMLICGYADYLDFCKARISEVSHP